MFLPFLFACGRKEESQPAAQNKIEEAVKEAVTKEFKMYEGAKAGLEKAERASQEKREMEKDVN
jgi:hypothetical protein